MCFEIELAEMKVPDAGAGWGWLHSPYRAPPTPGRAAALLVREAGVTPMVPRLPGDSAADTGLGFGGCRSVLGFLCGTDFPLRFSEPSGPWWDLSFMSGQDPSQAFT